MLPTLLIAFAGAAAPAAVADPDLASFFGWDPMRIVVVDRGCGPLVVSDFSGDGRPDLAVVNNGKSRIELFLLRDKEKTAEELDKDLKVNQLPPAPWYDRREVSLPQRVSAVRPFDVDGDGKMDLIYAGQNPAEIVVMQQREGVTFRVMNRQRVRGLGAGQGGLRIADVMDDDRPEVVAIAEEKVQVFPLGKDGTLGTPRRLTPDKAVGGLLIDDFNGDGRMDILGGVNDEQTPLRLWLQRQDPASTGKKGLLGSELRFETPALRDVDHARFPGRQAASLGVIERISRRVVFYDFVSEPIAQPTGSEGDSTERDVQAEAFGFADGPNKDRSVQIIDLDGDGLLDLLATDTNANTIVAYRQRQGVGLGDPEPFSAFKKPKTITAAPGGQWDGSATAKVFVLSEDEKAVGVADWNAAEKKLGFPTPIMLKTAGASPAAMGHMVLDGVGTLAIVVKDKRDHTLELHQPSKKEGDQPLVTAIPLKGVSRPPQSLIACDADQDGAADILLFTPGEPMVMVRGGAAQAGATPQVLTDKDMPNFGLVQSAGPGNTGLLDMDGDGKAELLIADRNFVRACKYDAKTGWRVVKQITISDPGTDLSGLAILGGAAPAVVASDKGNSRLVFIDPAKGEVSRRLRLSGFSPTAIFAGAFGGDGQPGVLGLSDAAFALTRLAGERIKLEQFAAYRSDSRDRSEYDLEFGDVNGDGFLDAVTLDGGEQMCSVLTFSAKRRVQLATEFEIFESQIFSGGDQRETEPRDLIITDATGDGKADLVTLIHDRVIVYPQATKKP